MNDRATIFIRNIDRIDDGADPLLNFINAFLSNAESSVPRLICTSNMALLPLESKAIGQWDGVLWALQRKKFRTTLLPLLKYFKGATLGLPTLNQRPWDIPPIAIDLLRNTDVTQITLNVLDYLIRAAWRENQHGLSRVIADLASLSLPSAIIDFDILIRSRPPKEDQELLQAITSPEARVARSQWLDSRWLAKSNRRTRAKTQRINFKRGESILFDVEKMRKIFVKMGVLPPKTNDVFTPGDSAIPPPTGGRVYRSERRDWKIYDEVTHLIRRYENFRPKTWVFKHIAHHWRNLGEQISPARIKNIYYERRKQTESDERPSKYPAANTREIELRYPDDFKK